MTSDITVRSLHEQDITAAVALLVGGSLTPGAEDPEQSGRYWDAALATRETGGDVLVAWDGEDLIGVCQVLILHHFQHTGGRCAELESVHVREDRRSRGVGAALLAAAENLARHRHCYRLQLTSNLVRHDAHRFYVTNGFEASHQGFKKVLTPLP